jgi:prepilin-type N-terminal cleavage/methylation domain-containing protein/prepilin-type processing-associated H-X9-DG protein
MISVIDNGNQWRRQIIMEFTEKITFKRRSLMGAAVTQGFTLIELLVVIAIIAILASILFPVFGRARENARRSSCQSNLKQIGLEVMQYTQDYDEKFPLHNYGDGAQTGFFLEMQPYMKSIQIYQCPSEPTGPVSDPAAVGYSDYAYNLALGWANGPRSLSQAVLTQTTLTVMVTEASTSRADSWLAGCNGSVSCAAGLAVLTGGSAQRHLETSNFLFCDGHVKAYKGSGPDATASVYNLCTAGSVGGATPGYGCAAPPVTPLSGNNPTFNYTP